MGFLSSLLGSGPSVQMKNMYSGGDFSNWAGNVLGEAEPFLADLLGQYFGASSQLMGGAFGGQQGNYAAKGVSSQLPALLNIAGQLAQGQRQAVVKPGSAGILPTALAGFGMGLGGASVPLLGKLLGLGGGGGAGGTSNLAATYFGPSWMKNMGQTTLS